MLRRHIGFWLLWLCLASNAAAQDPLGQLLQALEGITWPFGDAVLLKLEDATDYRRRLEAVLEILEEREAIHDRTEIDEFRKTQIVCGALRVLDGYDLPLVEQILFKLSAEENWKRGEKALLAYLCAKRDIHYEANVTYLFQCLTFYETDLESPVNRKVAWTIRETCDTLSYLGDLFVSKGDTRILGELFAYTSIAFGYPAEYFSNRLVGMLIKRPVLFVSSLSGSNEETIRDVCTSIGFGIRNDSIRKSVEEVLNDKLNRVEGKEGEVVVRLKKEVEALTRQWAREAVVSRP